MTRTNVQAIKKGSNAGNWLTIGLEKKKTNCTWTINNYNEDYYSIIHIYYDLSSNGTYEEVENGRCVLKKNSDISVCDDNVNVPHGTDINLRFRPLPAPFFMTIYYELVSKGCAGVVDIDTGVNMLDNFKSSRDRFHNFGHCVWYIPAIKKEGIVFLVFYYIKLNMMETSRTCWESDSSLWLTEFYKNSTAVVTWKGCGTIYYDLKIFKIHGSESAMASVSFYSEKTSSDYFNAGGFYSDSDCGDLFYKSYGRIEFLHGRTGYPHEKACTWMISHKSQPNLRYSIKTRIVFHYFDLENGINCIPDYVRILKYVDRITGYKEVKRLCNTTKALSFVNTHLPDNIAIQFKSDPGPGGNGVGFDLSHYQTMSGMGKTKKLFKDFDDHIYISNGEELMASWFYYSDKNFYLNIDINDLFIPNCDKGTLQVIDLEKKDSKRIVYDGICNMRKYQVKSRRILIQFKYDKRSIKKVHFQARLNFRFLKASSSSIVPSSGTPSSDTSAIQKKVSTNDLTVPSASSIVSSQLTQITISKEGGERSNGAGESNFLLYGGMIAGVMIVAITSVLVFVFLRSHQKKKRPASGILMNPVLKFDEMKPDTPPVSHTHNDALPLVKIGKTRKKSIRDKIKSTFGKDVAETTLTWNENAKCSNDMFGAAENKSYESGDECELYESKDDNRLSALSSNSEDNTPLYNFYGSKPNAKKKEEDIFLSRDDKIKLPTATASIKKHNREEETVNDLYGFYSVNDNIEVLPPIAPIGKKMEDETIEENLYASSGNPLYGSSSCVDLGKTEVNNDENDYYSMTYPDNDKKRISSDSNYANYASPIIEEDNYACPDSPMRTEDIEEQEYSYAASPGMENVEEKNDLYGYTEQEGNDREQENLLYE